MKLQPQDLKMRPRLALVLIVDFINQSPIHQAPQHSKLQALINEALPPHRGRGDRLYPVISSKEQTHRLADELRAAGLLVSAPGMQFNMVPTPRGLFWAREWAPQTTAWAKREWNEWAKQARSGRTQKSLALLERSVA